LATRLHNFRCELVFSHATITCGAPANMSSSRKKAIVRKFTRDWVAGYVSVAHFTHQGSLEVLDLGGKVLALSIQDVKWVCFVRDFNSGELDNPERFVRKSFSGRPRGEGLWLRLQLRDGDVLEGMSENNIGLLDADGFFLTPPDTRSNTQRVWLPRTALTEMEVVAVVGGAAKKKPSAAAKPEEERQETLFPFARG
jgi:hypothetical protein